MAMALGGPAAGGLGVMWAKSADGSSGRTSAPSITFSCGSCLRRVTPNSGYVPLAFPTFAAMYAGATSGHELSSGDAYYAHARYSNGPVRRRNA